MAGRGGETFFISSTNKCQVCGANKDIQLLREALVEIKAKALDASELGTFDLIVDIAKKALEDTK